MKACVLVVLFAACVSAQAPPEYQLVSEYQLSRAYVDTGLKIQRSLLSIQSSNEFSKVLALIHGETPQDPATQNLQVGGYVSNLFSNTANNLQYGGFPSYGAQNPTGPTSRQPSTVDEAKLAAAFQLLYATKLKFYESVFRTADVSNEFWTDRLIQLFVQSSSQEVPPEILQIVFIKLYRTNLETLKTSLVFQYISHFNSWLEDEIDVAGSRIEDHLGQISKVVEEDQKDDLVRDRLFAFSAFNSYAQLDFQTFYFDIYLESVFPQLVAFFQNSGMAAQVNTGNAATSAVSSSNAVNAALSSETTNTAAAPETPANTASFLEEKSSAQPFTDILATGSFAAGNQISPYLFTKVYNFYHLLFQMYTAHSGLTSAYAQHLALEILFDNDPENDEKGHEFNKFGLQMMYGDFANNLRYSSQMEYVSALYDLALLYSPVLGSLGSSLGSSFGSL